MDGSPALSDSLAASPREVLVVLFSQEDCVFCREIREHYLRPMSVARPAGVKVAEVETGSDRKMTDWNGRPVTHAEFARAAQVRFMPTVMFFSARGQVLAPAIVGLSQDFFGGYLEARISTALRARSATTSGNELTSDALWTSGFRWRNQ